jgi:hypothetical protein
MVSRPLKSIAASHMSRPPNRIALSTAMRSSGPSKTGSPFKFRSGPRRRAIDARATPPAWRGRFHSGALVPGAQLRTVLHGTRVHGRAGSTRRSQVIQAANLEGCGSAVRTHGTAARTNWRPSSDCLPAPTRFAVARSTPRCSASSACVYSRSFRRNLTSIGSSSAWVSIEPATARETRSRTSPGTRTTDVAISSRLGPVTRQHVLLGAITPSASGILSGFTGCGAGLAAPDRQPTRTCDHSAPTLPCVPGASHRGTRSEPWSYSFASCSTSSWPSSHRGQPWSPRICCFANSSSLSGATSNALACSGSIAGSPGRWPAASTVSWTSCRS